MKRMSVHTKEDGTYVLYGYESAAYQPFRSCHNTDIDFIPPEGEESWLSIDNEKYI